MLEMLMQWYRRRFSDPEAIAAFLALNCKSKESLFLMHTPAKTDYNTSRTEIPSRCIRDSSVVRFIPNRVAAPRGPATMPLVSRNT